MNTQSANMTYAEHAAAEFKKTDTIPHMGQHIAYVDELEGDLHTFPDGSIALHGGDGTFAVGEITEE